MLLTIIMIMRFLIKKLNCKCHFKINVSKFICLEFLLNVIILYIYIINKFENMMQYLKQITPYFIKL